MRKAYAAAAMAVSLAAGSARAASLPADLAAAAHAYDQAQIHSDKAELERLIAPDYRLANSGGALQDKASFIADSTAPGFHIEPFKVDEPIEQVLGDTALLGGVSTLKGTDGGKPFEARLRFMDVWAKRAGAWQVIYTHVTRVPAK